MTYEQALSFIGSRLRFGIKPGLERTRELLARLGDPHLKLKCVHVAGTNGKGSVCTFVSFSLREKGLRVGLYTSPYISDFRERMQINGELISKEDLAEYTERASKQLEGIDGLTEFELITCIAFLWFYEKKCDVVVLETGLGGRLDSTNVIEKPLCSIITHIDLDHTAILGDTAEKIAGEKAGIIKPGCPVVIAGGQHDGALAVLEKTAVERGSRVIKAEVAKTVCCTLENNALEYKGSVFETPLIGAHQGENLGAAIEALRLLGVSDEEIKAGVKKAKIPARLEVLSSDPVIILDGAHNLNGATALHGALKTLLSDKKKIALMGILRDKDYSDMLALLAPEFDTIVTAEGYSDRELSSKELAEKCAAYAKAVDGGNFENALKRALEEQGNRALVICGSLYLAGAVRPSLIGSNRQTNLRHDRKSDSC